MSSRKPAAKIVTVMDADAIRRAITRIAHEILERNKGTDGLALVGIRSRGVHIAERIADARCAAIEARPTSPVGVVDITLYRDDLDARRAEPRWCRGTDIPFADRGQAHRAGRRRALSPGARSAPRWTRSWTSAGPQSIQLAVLVDRGHRELPIRADYVGKNLPTSRREQSVQVRLAEADGVDEVVIEG